MNISVHLFPLERIFCEENLLSVELRDSGNSRTFRNRNDFSSQNKMKSTLSSVDVDDNVDDNVDFIHVDCLRFTKKRWSGTLRESNLFNEKKKHEFYLFSFKQTISNFVLFE